MKHLILDYMDNVQLVMDKSPVIAAFQIVRSRVNTDDGYLRLRATLTNEDFLETAEYFVIEANQLVVVDYRYQWMRSDKMVLCRRWDNTPDHPGLENFPHHIHDGSETNVISSQPMTLFELLKFLEEQLMP